jgi:hypothetical protein
MAQIKYTEAGQEIRLERLKALRETRKELADLDSLKESPEWLKLASVFRKYETYAKREEKEANDEHENDSIDAQTFSKRVIRFRQKQADFDLAASIIDKHSSMIKDLDDKIIDLERQYKEAKQSLE